MCAVKPCCLQILNLFPSNKEKVTKMCFTCSNMIDFVTL